MEITELYTQRNQNYFLDVGGVVDITEHEPIHKGDKLYYEIEYESGIIHREFNPDTVIYLKGDDE